ncbi:hypothetical protein Agub_g3049, partial [Astrephomene gubernaculifera]
EGSQAASVMGGGGDGDPSCELAVDARRQRLLRVLRRALSGPALTAPLERLRWHSYGLLVVVLLTHVVCYVLIKQLIEKQHTNVYVVHRQALAMDRSQLVVWRIMMGPYCERKNVTAKVSACANTMNYTLGKLADNIALLEQYHQEVYLGSGGLRRLQPEVYDTWTAKHLQYNIYLDTRPPGQLAEAAGVWQLGNRFLAAAREALYWMPRMRDAYQAHRSWSFLVDAGLGPLFAGYQGSLELLMESAWRAIERMRADLVVMLVLEALLVQVVCCAYQGRLLVRVERARLLGVLALMGLPGHVVRQLASREIKVLEDDEEEDAWSVGGEEVGELPTAATTTT